MTSGAHQLAQSTRPVKPLLASESQTEAQSIALQKRNLNQASTTSFLVSEPIYESAQNGYSPNSSNLRTGVASASRPTNKDDETILSLNVQQMPSMHSRARANISP